jgi:putative ABC transport system permease protein
MTPTSPFDPAQGQPRPPRLASWLIERVVPPDARDAAIGDLDEEFHDEVVPRLGIARARRWYWRQTFSLARAFALARRSPITPRTHSLSRSDTMRHDLRDALRTILRSPGYSLITIAVLALGIGATSAIFSFVDGVLLRPLPYAEPDRLVFVWEKPPQGQRNVVSTENFLDWQRSNDVFEIMAAVTGGGVTMSGGTEPVQIAGQRVSAGFFDVYGERAAIGRSFAPDEDQPGKERVAVISYRLWQRQFAGDPQVIGRLVTFNGAPHTIIGVLPASSSFDRGTTEIWRPLAFGPAEKTRNFHWLRAIARLKPGVTIDQARMKMDAIGARIAKDYPASNKDWGVTIDRYADLAVSSSLRDSLQVLMWAVGALLLVGCTNLANLALARGTAREREIVIRAALGAGRARLFKQFLFESLMLSLAGGLSGLGVGYAMMRGLKLLLPPFFLPREALVTIDWRALVFALGISVVTGLIFGTAPAFQAGRVDLTGSMKGSSRSVTADRVRRRLRDGLVIVEVALACALLVGAGLLMKSFMRLQQVEAARDPATLVTAGLNAPDTRFPNPEAARLFYRRILERVASVPGVVDVSIASAAPMQGWGYGMPLRIPSLKPNEAPAPGGTGFKMVSPTYFQTIGLPILKGRGLSDADTSTSMPVLVVNQAFVDRYLKDSDPVGRHVLIETIIPGKPQLGPETSWEVVGVAANERVGGLSQPDSPGVYSAFEQTAVFGPNLVVRASRQSAVSAASLKAAVQEIDPNQPLSNVRTLEEAKLESVAPDRLRTWLIALFGAIAGLLASIGIYGMISYSVAQRTHEIGVRAALGASRGRLMGLVLGRASILTGLGLIAGLGTALASGKLLESLLFGVTSRDAVSLAAATILLGAVAMFAAWIPARRAARVDPLVALRVE